MWIGNSLKQRRKTLGWTAEQAAQKIGVSASHLYKLETGQRFPKLDVFRRIAQAYKVPIWVFLYCADDGVEVDPKIKKAYQEIRIALSQVVTEFL